MIGLGISHTVPSGSNSGMWPAILVITFIIWFICQCAFDKRAVIWRDRKEKLMASPFLIEFKRDVTATYHYAKDWPVRLGDRRRMKKLARTYELSED